MRSTPQGLLSRVRNTQDHEAWQEFDSHYRDLLIRFCRRRGIPHVDAEDVVQGVFVSLSRSLQQFIYDKERGRFRDYLYRCVRNAISEWSARPNRQLETLVPECGAHRAPNGGATSNEGRFALIWEEEWVAHHYRQAMRTIRESFDEKSANIFDRSVAGEKVAELAKEHGLSEQAVYKIRQRIRDRMEELIAQQIRDEDSVDEPEPI
jgi:RNA polymerase sigma factor (sigma-70 family)